MPHSNESFASKEEEEESTLIDFDRFVETSTGESGYRYLISDSKDIVRIASERLTGSWLYVSYFL